MPCPKKLHFILQPIDVQLRVRNGEGSVFSYRFTRKIIAVIVPILGVFRSARREAPCARTVDVKKYRNKKGSWDWKREVDGKGGNGDG